MPASTSVSRDEEGVRKVSPFWALMLFLVGTVLLGISTKLHDDLFYKPIIESVGDGLLLLGLVDLLFRPFVISWMTRARPIVQMLQITSELRSAVQEHTGELEKISDRVHLITIEGQGQQLHRDALALAEGIAELMERTLRIEHLLDPKAKAEYELKQEIMSKLAQIKTEPA